MARFPLLKYLNAGRSGFLQPSRNLAADVAALLDRNLGDARERLPALLPGTPCLPRRKISGWPGTECAVGEHLDATCSVRLGPQPLRCRRTLLTPAAQNTFLVPIRSSRTMTPSASTFSTAAPVRTSTPSFSELGGRGGGKRLGERGQDAGTRLQRGSV